jgi:hypothetical protein
MMVKQIACQLAGCLYNAKKNNNIKWILYFDRKYGIDGLKNSIAIQVDLSEKIGQRPKKPDQIPKAVT